MKVILLEITKSIGFEVLLQERNSYIVQIYQQNFTIYKTFLSSIRNSIVKQTRSKSNKQKQLDDYDDKIKFYLNLSYIGNVGEQLVRNYIKKHKENIWKEVHLKFFVTYNTAKDFEKYESSHHKGKRSGIFRLENRVKKASYGL